MVSVGTKVDKQLLPFYFHHLGDGEVQLLFSSFDGEITITETVDTIRSWMRMNVGEPLFFEKYPVWMMQKRDDATLVVCLRSHRNTIFPRDIYIKDLGALLQTIDDAK
ncbi:MAG: hypothetical protein WAV51_01235 [Microgenomates group bacterium]